MRDSPIGLQSYHFGYPSHLIGKLSVAPHCRTAHKMIVISPMRTLWRPLSLRAKINRVNDMNNKNTGSGAHKGRDGLWSKYGTRDSALRLKCLSQRRSSMQTPLNQYWYAGRVAPQSGIADFWAGIVTKTSKGAAPHIVADPPKRISRVRESSTKVPQRRG